MIQIHKELEKHIWPLKPEEYRILEQSILEEGIRDKIVTWQGYIIDGHNRYKIAQEHGLTFDTLEKDFDSIEDVKDWMDANQLGRRNLTKDQFEISIGRRYNREKKNKQDTLKQNLPIGQIDPSGTTADRIASEYNISAPTVKRYAKKAEEYEKLQEEKPEVAKAIWTGGKSLKDVQKEIKEEEQKAKLKELENYDEPFDGLYDVIVIDPPWPMQKIDREVRPNQTGFDYPTMTEQELSEMKLPLAEDCHGFIWTTHKFLPMALRLLDKWGMKYVLCMTWHKNGGFQPFGLPQYNSEFCLYARKGNPKFRDTKNFFTCFQADRTGHSKKPDVFYEIIRRVTSGRRLDMFARRKIEGFFSWGNQSAGLEGR